MKIVKMVTPKQWDMGIIPPRFLDAMLFIQKIKGFPVDSEISRWNTLHLQIGIRKGGTCMHFTQNPWTEIP